MNQTSLGISKVIVDGVSIDMPTTRAAAKAKGIKRYYTGKPCPKGHMAYRYAAGGACSECQAARAKEKYTRGWRQDTTTRKQINTRWNTSGKGAVAKQRWREKNPKRAWAVYATSGAKFRATRARMPFDLDSTYILSITPDVCPVFGTEFKFIGNGQITPDSATLDKLKPELGYVRGNVAVISMKANAIKNAFTSEDVLRVGQWMQERGL